MGRRMTLPVIAWLEGNRSKRPIAQSGVEAIGRPFIPKHLMNSARGCAEVVRSSMPDEIYSQADSFLLAAFGMAWAVHQRAASEISKPGFAWLVSQENGSTVPSPWLKVINAQAKILASLGDRLGLDPKSRAQLSSPSARKESKFDGLLLGAQTSLQLSRNN
jgi:P27 family predicted phage terminase small subunit